MAFNLHRSDVEDRARALDPATSKAELVRLAAHRDPAVKAAVASRWDCPLASMLSLVLEDDVRVLEALATNPHAPRSVLEPLSAHKREQIRVLASRRLRVLAPAA